MFLEIKKDYVGGALEEYNPETILYMIGIIEYVWIEEENRDAEGIQNALQDINLLCIGFIEGHIPSPPTNTPSKLST